MKKAKKMNISRSPTDPPKAECPLAAIESQVVKVTAVGAAVVLPPRI